MNRSHLSLPAAGFALVTVTAASLLLDVPAETNDQNHPQLAVLVLLMMVAVAIYFLAVRLALRRTWPLGTVWMVLGIAVLLRAVILVPAPFLSNDIYRYVWDGRVQAAGINPYDYVPADPALASLRDAAIYPNINRADYARTIYPPVAQLTFAAVGHLHGGVTAMRLVMLGFEALGVACMLGVLRLAGLPRERILIYAWSPLPVWSFAGDGHVDAVAIGLLGVALLLRAHHRDGLAGAALAGAALVKFLPVVVAPAFLRGGRFWRPALAGTAVLAMCYGLYLGAGAHVLGFLPDYGREEGIVGGGGIWLIAALGDVVTLPTAAAAAYAVLVVAVFAGLIVTLLRRPAPANDVVTLCRDTATLAAIAMVAISPHYHWYFAWLALPAVVAPSRALLWLSTTPLILLLDLKIPGDRVLGPSLIYLPALLLLARDLWRPQRVALAQPAIPGDAAWPLRPR